MSLENGENVDEIGIDNAVIEPELDDDGNPVVTEPELDDEGNPIVAEVPAWMQEEEEDAQTSPNTVPLAALMKQKNKGKEKDGEIERLNKRIRELETAPPKQGALKRPRSADYETEAEHEDALEEYDRQLLATGRADTTTNNIVAQRAADRNEAVEGFIARADAVAVKHKIDPATYKGASDVVQKIVEQAFPNMGDDAYPEFLSRLEDGDETTLYYIGRNKAQQGQLEQLLSHDPTGIKAFRHIARLTERNTGAKTKISQAPKPAAVLRGTAALPAQEGAFKKKYDAAHKAGQGQTAFDIKSEAKKAGIDTRKWVA